MTAIAIQHREEILRRMSAGEPITKIALDLGYANHAGIINRLGDDEDYRQALKSGLVGKIEKREQELEKADTNVTVTRADRLLGHARWWAERLDPERFSAKTELRGSKESPLFEHQDREMMLLEIARAFALTMAAGAGISALQQEQKALTNQGAEFSDSSVIPQE